MKHTISSIVTILLVFVAFGISSAKENTVTTKSTIENIIAGPEFDDGWEDGYCEGWKDVKGQYAYCPYAPYPPYPEYGKDTYRGGYNAGFKAGMKAAREQ